jgi:hypothetical protein
MGKTLAVQYNRGSNNKDANKSQEKSDTATQREGTEVNGCEKDQGQ